jgi:D-inositol-3-phosphate glycosyltransferase
MTASIREYEISGLKEGFAHNGALRVCFVVESGTDVRMVEGLAQRFELTVVARKIHGRTEISRPLATTVATAVGPGSRVAFVHFVLSYLRRRADCFDYIIVQGYGLAALAVNLASRLTGIPTAMLVCSPVEAYYLCRVINATSETPFRRRELVALQAVARMNARLGARYIVLSQYLADVVRDHGTIKPVHVIPVYGVDTSVFSPAVEPKKAAKARRGLPTSGSLLFFSSRIAPEKDGRTLLIAVQSLLASGRDLWLLHRSGGYQTFAKDAGALGIGQRVITTDAVHPHLELPLDYKACDVCVQASREEGLGFSALEALASSTPVVAAKVGGLRETVLDGQTGWAYPVGDANALAQSIETVLDHPREATRRAAAGRELVCKYFESDFVFERLRSVVEEGVFSR